MFKPKVSIVIPVYNGSDYLGEAIKSALNQTYKNIEILVINDGSNDKGVTEKIALSFGDKIKYFNKENGGVSSALNLGIKHMTGEYFSWLSHDDLYFLNKIEKQIKFLEKLDNKNLIISSNYEFINEGGITISNSKIKKEYYENLLFSIFTRKYPIYGCGLLIPKIIFNKCGNFNTKLKCSQDYELWLRIIKEGNLFIFQDEIITKYRKHGNQGTNENSNLYKRCILEESNLYLKYLLKIGFKKILNGGKKRYFSIINPIIFGYLIIVFKKIGIHKYMTPIRRKYFLKK